MKKYILIASILLAIPIQAIKIEIPIYGLYLQVSNKTPHNIEWETLTPPSRMGKIPPVILAPFGGTKRPNIIMPDTILSFKNVENPQQVVFVDVQLQTRSPQAIRYNPDAPPELVEILTVTIKDGNKKILRPRLIKQINPGSRYQLNITLKGDDLQNTTIELIEQPKEIQKKIRALQKVFNIKPINKESR